MTVKHELLRLLSIKNVARYTEIKEELGRPDRTIYVTLLELQKKGLITKAKDKHGAYILTDLGILELAKLNEIKQVCERYDALIEEIKHKEGEMKA